MYVCKLIFVMNKLRIMQSYLVDNDELQQKD